MIPITDIIELTMKRLEAARIIAIRVVGMALKRATFIMIVAKKRRCEYLSREMNHSKSERMVYGLR